MRTVPVNTTPKRQERNQAPAPALAPSAADTAEPEKRDRRGGPSHRNGREVKSVVLFLGAGTSSPYGMPTTRSLKEKISVGHADFPNPDMLDEEFPDIEHVLSTLTSIIDFGESRAGKHYARQDGGNFARYASNAIKSRAIIQKIIASSYRWDLAYGPAAESIVSRLFSLARSDKGKIAVFTTNYDTVIEEYCRSHSQSIECIDGFVHDKAGRRYVWKASFEPTNEAAHTKVFLYKLHGSTTWQAGEADDKNSIVHKPDGSPSADLARDMYIRPSLDAKDVATQNEPYLTILKKFKEIIPLHDVCVVVGYSFRDKHVSEVLVDLLNSCKILIAVSPTAAADFWEYGLGRKLPPGKKEEWEKVQLCGMKFATGDRQGLFYALHAKLSVGTVDDIANEIESLIKDRPPGYPLGSLITER